MGLEIDVTEGTDGKAKGSVHVALTGSLDTATAPALEKALAPALDGATTVVVFDLAGLDFISSAGLRVLMAARKRLSARKGKLLLKNPRPHVQKVFEIVKALPDVKIFASVQELDEYLASIQAHG